MKFRSLPWGSIVVAVAIVVAVVVLSVVFRYQALATAGANGDSRVFIVDRWTGRIWACPARGSMVELWPTSTPVLR